MKQLNTFTRSSKWDFCYEGDQEFKLFSVDEYGDVHSKTRDYRWSYENNRHLYTEDKPRTENDKGQFVRANFSLCLEYKSTHYKDGRTIWQEHYDFCENFVTKKDMMKFIDDINDQFHSEKGVYSTSGSGMIVYFKAPLNNKGRQK